MINIFGKHKQKNSRFSKNVLRKNDIALLIIDERFNNLFKTEEKSPEIVHAENVLKALLKEQARICEEQKAINLEKKAAMKLILSLTDEAYTKNDSDALKKMHDSQSKIKTINHRMAEIEKRIEEMPDRIKEANLDLLEATVNKIYFKIRSNQKRIEELEPEIKALRARIKECINERETLMEVTSSSYSYFHDLLGAEELEKLDRYFLPGNQ